MMRSSLSIRRALKRLSITRLSFRTATGREPPALHVEVLDLTAVLPVCGSFSSTHSGHRHSTQLRLENCCGGTNSIG